MCIVSAAGKRSELGTAIAEYRSAFIGVALLSAVLNILLLGGSIYMMLIYDSVLPSHSIPTLLSLLAMIIVVYIFQGMFDSMRSRLLADVGSALDRKMSPRVQHAMEVLRLRGARTQGDGLMAMRDLDQVRSFLSGTGPSTLIDLPWIIFFLAILFLLHFWLGVTALVGALVLIAMTWATDRATKEPLRELGQIASYRNGAAESNLRHAEMLSALGMQGRMRARWDYINGIYLAAQNKVGGSVTFYGGLSKMFRLFLQSGILSVGALLVIDGKASGGVIFASSILSGRALAPLDQAIANWRNFASARLGWGRINEMLEKIPAETAATVLLPRPSTSLVVEQLVVAPPGSQRVTAQGVDFTLKAGDALGVIGPSAAGKTSLGRALIGIWRPARGTVRLDGATLDQWDPEQLGSFLGYLPQTVELLDGNVAENISRFTEGADSADIIAAARIAGVHEMIVQLPQGYDTPVGSDGSALSAGQRQRIGLARALYGDPFLLLLDEPNSNLDVVGEQALEQAIGAISARGGISIIISHRPSALAKVSHVLFMREGRMEAFGPRDEVLAKVMVKPRPIEDRAADQAQPKQGAA